MSLFYLFLLMECFVLASTCSVFVCTDTVQRKFCTCLKMEMAKCTMRSDRYAKEELEGAWSKLRCDGYRMSTSFSLVTVGVIISLALIGK